MDGGCPAQQGGGGGRVFLAKLDLQNAYRSMRLPPMWRKVLVVKGGSGRKFRYARLPFGWSYSPAICQQFVLAVVRRVLSRRGIRGWVYLDDILLSARRKGRLRGAIRECQRLLRRAGFIVGAKSETTPTECISFIGKQLDRHYQQRGRCSGGCLSGLGQGSGAWATAKCSYGAASGEVVLAWQAECRVGGFPCRRVLLPPPGTGPVRAWCGKGNCQCAALVLHPPTG